MNKVNILTSVELLYKTLVILAYALYTKSNE